MSSGKPRTGDRVTVTVEGEVSYAGLAGFKIRAERIRDEGVYYRYDDPTVKNVEVTLRVRRIGDVINRDDLAEWSPLAGTMIRDMVAAMSYMKLVSANWASERGAFVAPWALPAGDYRILMLPGEWVDIS